MSVAPLYEKVGGAPAGGVARWIETADGVRLRLANWDKGDRGTVLIFPGRSEYIEKYGRVVGEFQQRGFAVAVIDWRGQGLSDRLLANRQVGHVAHFQDYQQDVAAMLAAVEASNTSKPNYLCAHSMGGTIALRALHNALPVERIALTAPMWGLKMEPVVRPLAHAVAAGVKSVGMGGEFTPGTGPESYIVTNGFEGNTLTSDPGSFAFMARQIKANPSLSIGGPSINWFHAALSETSALMRMPAPDYETLCLLGSDESVVDTSAIFKKMEQWPNGRLEIIKGAQHEIMMETPQIQKQSFDMMDGFFAT